MTSVSKEYPKNDIKMAGMFAKKGKLLADFKVGKNSLSVTKEGRYLFASLNGIILAGPMTNKEYIRAVPVISHILGNLTKKNKGVNAHLASDSAVDEILKVIRDNHKDVEILMLELKPDEQTENTPREVNGSKKSEFMTTLSDYDKLMRSFSANTDEVCSLSSSLLRTVFPDTMCGSKTIKSILSSIIADLDRSADTIEDMEGSLERVPQKVRHIAKIIKDPKIFPEEVASSVPTEFIKDYNKIKTALSDLSVKLYPLYDIDRMFRKCTGFPTTWFFNSSVFYDFTYAYETLIKNLMLCSRIEPHVIEPLIVWKVRTIGDPKCQII